MKIENQGRKPVAITVTWRSRKLRSNAARQEREEKDGEKVIRSERYVGRVSRSFRLATDVDEAAAIAKFENGVLELTLPKKAVVETSKRLTIT
jgi:HSP20 family protein